MSPSDEGKLTAWERWELAEFDAPKGKAAAQAEAEPAVKLPTAEEVEQILQQAREQGHQAGYDEGQRSGYEKGQVKAREEAARLAAAAGKLDAAMRSLEAGVADELLALALEVARQTVRREIAANPEILLDVVKEALGQLPHQHAAIYLHPDDASLLRSYQGDQLAHAGHRIHEDAKLKRGDCILEAGGSHVDATVATRWRRVLEGLGLDDAWTPAGKPE